MKVSKKSEKILTTEDLLKVFTVQPALALLWQTVVEQGLDKLEAIGVDVDVPLQVQACVTDAGGLKIFVEVPTAAKPEVISMEIKAGQWHLPRG